MATSSRHHSPARDEPLRLLLVKLKHIGDALLLTPTICAIRRDYPNAEIWVVVRKGAEGILAGCPEIDRLVTVTPIDSTLRTFADRWRDIQTWLELRRQKFDYAFEMTDGDRGRWLAGMSGARHRCANISLYRLSIWWRRWFNRRSESRWADGHRVVKDFKAVADFLPLSGDIPPLRFERSIMREPGIIRELDDFIVLHPGTRWPRKQWPVERWLRLGDALLDRVKTLVVSCGPDAEERALAAELVAAWGAERAVSADGACGWDELAGMLSRARLYVGVDTAAMHLAAACQCPIVALFGDSVVAQWSPWQVPHEVVHPGDFLSAEEISRIPAREIIRRLTPEMALAAADRLIRPAPASDPA